MIGIGSRNDWDRFPKRLGRPEVIKKHLGFSAMRKALSGLFEQIQDTDRQAKSIIVCMTV
jgi:hypothetical protein